MVVTTPDIDFDVLLRQGATSFQARDFARALSSFDRALAISPDDTRVLNYRARTLEALGRLDEALKSLEQAVTLDPDNAADWRNRGLALRKLGRLEEAVASFDEALRRSPEFTDVLVKKASALDALERREEALECIERALALEPTHLWALNTRGTILDHLERYAEALADFTRMAALDPGNVDALNNTGMIYARRGEFVEAQTYYDRSLSQKPDQPAAHYNRSMVRLALGNWVEGFAEYEYRWQVAPLEAVRFTHLGRRWTGIEEVKGKTVLLHHEQGYGDTLQFVRFAQLVRERGARVILAVPAGLKNLLETLPGRPTLVTEGDPIPAHDYYCPMMSLAMALATTPVSIPSDVPYLTADPRRVMAWRDRLGPQTRLRIGITWSGRQTPPINYPRDIPLQKMRPLLELDAEFVSLQPSMFPPDRDTLSSLPALRHDEEALRDFADTAALIANLDLVIAVDSAVAHLAGALAKPVWLLNRYASCWRWLQHGDGPPWYPTMRLFRQTTQGDWDSVIARVCREAGARIASSGGASARVERIGHEVSGSPQVQSCDREQPARPALRVPKLVTPSALREEIRFVCATRKSSEEFFASAPLGRSLNLYRTFPRDHRIELRLFKENREGLSTVYNTAIEEARDKPAILVFIHDDVFLNDFYWAKHLLEGLERFEIVGLAGNRCRAPHQASWMYLNDQFVRDRPENLSGVLGHGKGFPELIELSDYGDPGHEVKLLDGVILAVRSTTLLQHDLRFDPRFRFHFYDMDFCRQAEQRGIRMGTWALSLIHASAGRLGVSEWRRAYKEYLAKYGE
jgi:tetratricopeptide (TPR) repeat protein